jgi:hypothetical protein
LEAFEVNCATDTVTVGARAANVKDLESDPLELEADGQLNQPTRYVRVGVVAIVDPVLDGCDFFRSFTVQTFQFSASPLAAIRAVRKKWLSRPQACLSRESGCTTSGCPTGV